MGQSLAIATFIPFLGIAVGPTIGGLLTGSIGWRWAFLVVSIFDAMLRFCALLILPETHAGTILHRKAKKLRKDTGEPYYAAHEKDNERLGLRGRLAVSLSRPVRLLATQPTLQLMSLFLAYNYGILYIVQSTFATMWIERYEQSVSVSGLHYITLAIGLISASMVGGRVMDRVFKHLKARAEGETQPEFRVPLMIPGAIIIPIGLLWYGWTAQVRAFWILPDIGIAVFGAGIIVGTQAMQAYVMDSFPKYVASASAASSLLRSIAGFAFPLFAPRMYHTLGYGWGNSLLAGLFLLLAIPAPFVLWKYGAWLRAKGKPQW